MREVATSELQPGMIVGRTIRGRDDRVLLARGVRLDERLIKVLQSRRLGAIWVSTVAEATPSPVTERVARTARAHLDRLFQLALLASSGDTRRAREAERMLDRLLEDVEAIIADVAAGAIAERLTTLSQHHQQTFDYSVDVAIVSAVIARKLYFDLPSTRSLVLGALLHDIGKVRVPVEILNKPGPLTPDEWAVIRQHPIWGAEILQSWELEDGVPATVALQHHEQQSGFGYPQGRRGTNRIFREAEAHFDPTRIHLAAEVVAVAGMYVALTTDQPYRKALSLQLAVPILRERAGPHLNRQIVEALLALLPSFPLGTPVRVVGGRYHGYKGVVVRIEDARPTRPVVRLLTDRWEQRVKPFEFDTAADDEAELRAELGSALDTILGGEQ
ncbi:MAG: HD-GYP domain-containing protein [Chloroflexi bacterium]|nr:HD-GYP domain-containing protein [Chloroflexota bacterium]